MLLMLVLVLNQQFIESFSTPLFLTRVKRSRGCGRSRYSGGGTYNGGTSYGGMAQNQQSNQLLAFGVGVVKGVLLAKLLTPTPAPRSALTDVQVNSKLKKKKVVVMIVVKATTKIPALGEAGGQEEENDMIEGPEQVNPRFIFQEDSSRP